MNVGIDFDNTIAGYDHLFSEIALKKGWIGRPAGKAAVRDSVRGLEDGEIKWQDLQAEVYGPSMDRAELIAGAAEFLLKCKERSISVFIVSHKTRYAKRDSSKTDLREAARRWMSSRGFFSDSGFAILEGHVYFESSRDEKVARIVRLECTHFVDDLVEVFLHPTFPADVKRYLFAHSSPAVTKDGIRAYPTWGEISDDILGSH